MRTKELGDLLFARLASGDAQREIVERAVWRINDNAIKIKEHKRRHGTGSFIPVDEWMVLYEVEHVGRRHLEREGVQQLATERCMWLGNGRIQKVSPPYRSIWFEWRYNTSSMERKSVTADHSARRFRSSPNLLLILSSDARSCF